MNSSAAKPCIVRVASLDDATAVADLYAPIVRDTCISFEWVPPTSEEMRTRMGNTLQTLPWLVGVDMAGEVCGYVYASRHRERVAYQWSVDTTAYVRSDMRGQGVGKLLYAELKCLLTQLGYCQAFAGIALPNAASVALHEAVGFETVGVYRRVGFKQGRWHDVAWWQCHLQDPVGQTPEPPRRFSLQPGSPL